MKCKITTLVENCVYGRKLKAEHGLSLFVEAGDNVVLHPIYLYVMHVCCIAICSAWIILYCRTDIVTILEGLKRFLK